MLTRAASSVLWYWGPSPFCVLGYHHSIGHHAKVLSVSARRPSPAARSQVGRIVDSGSSSAIAGNLDHGARSCPVGTRGDFRRPVLPCPAVPLGSLYQRILGHPFVYN